MGIQDRLLAELRTANELCDDCLSESAHVRPRQTVNQYCHRLAAQGQLKRVKRQCRRCRGWKIVNVLPQRSRSDVVRTAAARFMPSTLPKPARHGQSGPWYWEGNVQERLKHYLASEGWTIVRSANTETREPGKDLVAKRGFEELWVSVKGWPEKSPNVQARHWFSGAVFDLILYRTESATANLAIGIPAGFRTYENLLPRVQWLRERLPFKVYFVAESDEVTVIGPGS